MWNNFVFIGGWSISAIVKIFCISIGLSGILGCLVMFYIDSPAISEKPTSAPAEISVNESLLEIDQRIVKLDLQEYGLSAWKQTKLLTTLSSASRKYGIPLIVLHTFLTIESSYQSGVTHDRITIRVMSKNGSLETIHTRAIGLGGIVWEYWKDSLKANGVAATRDDLFEMENNIHATAYILRVCMQNVAQKSTVHNLFDNIIRRYYGDYSAVYKQRVLNSTSQIWLRRISRDLLAVYK